MRSKGTERVQFSVILEYGDQAANDQSRVLTLGSGDAPSWTQPTPADGGANPGGTPNTPLLPGLNTNDAHGAGALFCSDLVQLADGRILAAGGTQLLPRARHRADPARNHRARGPEEHAHLRPGRRSLGADRLDGVRALVPDAGHAARAATSSSRAASPSWSKPVYPDNPLNSGRNVVQTETFDVGCGLWSENGPLGERTLPTYPRMHLLPNGQVFYNAGGSGLRPGRLRLRHGALERRRHLRPGDAELDAISPTRVCRSS